MIVISVLAILMGGALIAYPDMSILVYGIMLSAYLIVQGIVLIVLDIKAWRMYVPFDGLLKGILSLILGILLIKNLTMEGMAAYLGIVFGIYIIIYGISGIKTSVLMRRTGAPWVLMLIINIISILFGCMILYSPIFSALTLTVYAGIVLIVEAIITIILMIIMRKHEAEVEKIIIEKVNEIEAQEVQEVQEVQEAQEAQEDTDK